MLKKTQKKRNAGKNKSCPKNSNQKYPTVPRNDAVEVGEMVTMDHDGASGGLDVDGEQTDYLQLAWLLREKLNDLVDGDKGEFPGLGLRSLLDMASSRNIVSVDPKMLNPVLWRTLPKEMLLLVLARLPLRDIIRLRCLSREWRRDMATVNSEINQACHEASPTMIALLSHGYAGSTNEILVIIYDFAKCRQQHTYPLHLRRLKSDSWEQCHHPWATVVACDGGLVCFMSQWNPTKRYRLCFVVVNLLTQVQHELPPLHYLYFAFPQMVQIKVDFDTKYYKVVVVGCRRGGITVEIYDSGTRQWTGAAPPCGSIFGPAQNWTGVKNCYQRFPRTTLGAYDFAEGKLELYSKNTPSIGVSVIDSVLEKDRMFVLEEQMQMDASHRGMVHVFSITEYHFENQTKDWVQGKSYECPCLDELIVEGSPNTKLNACDGFLMVTVGRSILRSTCFWLLNLSTSHWSKLLETSAALHPWGSELCRASWNAIP